MKKLNFSKEYGRKIEEGLKKQTIRLSTSLKEGDRVKVIVGGKILGVARITKIERKIIEELTEEDAKNDGFESLAQLIKALKKHYGKINGKNEICIIGFEMEKKAT
ncbi:MAG: ASCH domain-containing protein [Candidatus Nezhaarchaeales archaeon]